MKRQSVIAGNWKMNMDLVETRTLIQEILKGIKSRSRGGQTVVLCPPFTSLVVAGELLKSTGVFLGGQDISRHENGAYTGEISGKMLVSSGCRYVIVGHSERRQYHSESDQLVKAKAAKALQCGLVPIVCVGETLAQREQGETMSVIATQVRTGLDGFTPEQASGIIVAYEPVWAIGTGRTATPGQAQEIHLQIRNLLSGMFGKSVAEQTVIQYGGSVKPDNAGDLLSQPDIDGALVGGACLQAESFLSIIESARA